MSEPSCEVIYVCGHKKPDADSAVSAYVAAALLRGKYPEAEVTPILAGEVGPQVEFIFKEAAVELPEIKSDLRPCVVDCMRPARTLHESASLGEAMDLLLSESISLLPIVSDDSDLKGFVSTRRPEAQFLFHMNVEDFVGTLISSRDLIRGLHLVPLNSSAETAPPEVNSIRVSGQAVDIAEGTWLIAGSLEMVRQALSVSPTALIIAECHEEEVLPLIADCGFPCWSHEGTLLALSSALPRALPVSQIMSSPQPTISAEDLLEDAIQLLSLTPHALPVVTPEGRLLGVISHRSALRPPQIGLVLVDHFERSQIVDGHEEATILEIIDHHRVGTIETEGPVQVDCRPLGSTASILTCRSREVSYQLSTSEATLLLGALVSDTLLLTSPTTTDLDREIALFLSNTSGKSLEEFGRAVLEKNDRLASARASELVAADLKSFTQAGCSFLVGQIETTNLSLLPKRQEELSEALESARDRAQCDFALLMVTDVFLSQSHLLIADTEPARAKLLLGVDEPAAGAAAPGMVSRKKQLLPMILKRLSTA